MCTCQPVFNTRYYYLGTKLSIPVPHLTYTEVVLLGTGTSQKVNILIVSTHGKGRHSMKSFSIVGPTMWNELLTDEMRECTSVDVAKKRLKSHMFHLHY